MPGIVAPATEALNGDRTDRDNASRGTGDVEGHQLASSEPGLGSRNHVQRTLERARETIAEDLRCTRSGSALPLGDADGDVDPDTLARGTRPLTALRASLRTSVTAYVRRLRDDGAPPERTVVSVKTAVRDVIPPELSPPEARALLEEVVTWTIATYYE